MADTSKAEAVGVYRNRIDIVEDDQLRDWARRLAVTPEKLKEAAAKVGTWCDDLQFELNKG